MRYTRLVATLLAVLAGVLGVTTSMAETPADPPAAQPGQVAPPDNAMSFTDREAMARPQRSFRQRHVTDRSDDAPGTTPSPAPPDHPCRTAEQPAPSPSPTSTPAGAAPSPLPTPAASNSACGPDGTAGVRPVTAVTCTLNVTSAAQVNSAHR
ncbi:MAG: hypothetical protein ACRDS0_15605 [Pseudonocardiaceae bacterium]